MTPDHWQAIEALYHAALQLTGEPRSELLRRADPKVRSTVEAMLAQEASAVLHWLRKKGLTFKWGADEATELTETQTLTRCKMYIAAMRIADA